MASSSSHHADSLSSKKYPYPAAAEVNLRDFVPINLSKENYFVWKTLMLRLIESQDMVGFINGEVSAPPERNITVTDDSTKEIEKRYFYDWKRSDALIQRWIIGTINENVLRDVVCLKSAKDMWERLITLHERKIEYPYPEEVNVGDFVPKLSRENYSMWAKFMFGLIEREGLVGFINGEVSPPEEVNVGEYKAWKRTDDLLQMWIMNTIWGQDVRACVEDSKTAHDMWIKLEKDLTQTVINIESERKDVRVDISTWELTLAVRSKQSHIVKNLLENMSAEDVISAVNDQGQTSLHIAAAAGNLEAAKLLVDREPNLPNIPDNGGELPLQRAALFGHRNLVHYLLGVTTRVHIESSGAWFVNVLIGCGLYDIALLFVRRYHSSLAMRNRVDHSLLQTIAMENSAFRSGSKFNFWQSLIYSYVPMRLEESTIGNPIGCCNYYGLGRLAWLLKQKLGSVFWKVAEMIVPQLKNIRETKWKHHHAFKLVEHLCTPLTLGPLRNSKAAADVMKTTLLTAATSGIPEIVEAIISRFPKAIHYKNEEGQNLFHIAILNRRRNVFELICERCDKSDLRTILSLPNSSDKTCLDMFAHLNSEQQLILKSQAAGAALQMQLELQWFQEVKKLSILYERKWAGKSHEMIFSKTHEDLLKEGEIWLKDTANSCTIVAALIVTIVFAAAITVPGGNDGNSGHPIFSTNKAFIIFIISDALALYSSTSSLLLFLSILTSRYAEIDFLHTLPKRLIIGLITLFISIVSMMIAFGATLFVVFGHKKPWILGPISVFSIVPVISFVSSQFPLLRDMIKSTYGGGIFGKDNDVRPSTRLSGQRK